MKSDGNNFSNFPGNNKTRFSAVLTCDYVLSEHWDTWALLSIRQCP